MSDFLFDTTISALEKAMDGSALRQKAIADNIANVNTPGYKSKFVAFEDQLKEAIANGDEDNTSELMESIEPKVFINQNISYRTDQSNVDIDGEMAKLAENQLYYSALSRLTEKKFRILQQVISEGRK